MNLENIFTGYINSRYNQLSKNTIKNYKADVRIFIKWYERKFNLPLTSNPSWVNIQTIIDIYKKEKILESNLSPRSFKRHLSSLRKFFEFLKTEGIILQDPFKIKTLSNETPNQNDKWYFRKYKNYMSINNKSNHTIKNYIFDAQRFLTWAHRLTDDDIFSKIDNDLLNEYKKSLIEKGLAVNSIKRNLYSIQKYIAWINTEADIKTSTPTSSSSNMENGSIFDPLNYWISKITGRPMFKDVPGPRYKPSPNESSPIPYNISHKIPNWYKGYHLSSIAYYLRLSLLSFLISILTLISYQNLNLAQEKLMAPKIISPISKIDQIHAGILSPLTHKSIHGNAR